ncbi:hypothetical protein BG011_010136 [Mortierella polycephala]|uniref:Uncharacterized protein n=1 Tax=Mortierella polycephala TaxID=41804 RepID=A0A9P6TW61_9FUNG|nr:hypothetical protein BG011_010136 [Mortierella polycephala]
MEQTPGLTSAHMQQILASRPRLHIFVTLADGQYISPEVTHFLPKDFIDLDPASNSLKPWKCESSHKVFSAKIMGIPRPDITLSFYGLPQLQRGVYERLARLTHLEQLDLGHDDRDFGSEDLFVVDVNGKYVYGDPHYQYDCLEMGPKNGLGILEGLRELRELSVMRNA